MGLESHGQSLHQYTNSNEMQESFKLDLATNSVRGTVQSIFMDGGMITADGNTVFRYLNESTLPERIQEKYKEGRITECFTSEVGKISINERPRRVYVIPPNSNTKLTYSIGKHGGIDIHMLHGLDDRGLRISDNLYHDEGLTHALRQLSYNRFRKYGLDTKIHSPKKAVNEALKELALEQSGGLGEASKAIRRMHLQKSTYLTRRKIS